MTTQKEYIQELRDALMPLYRERLALISPFTPPPPDDTPVGYTVVLTFGDLQKAREVLMKKIPTT